MKTFHYLPPAPEEQKAFVAQLLGTIVALAMIVGSWFFLKEARMQAILAGVALGVIYLLANIAWKLEVKAQRAQNAEIVLDENELRITDRSGHTQAIPIKDIEKCDVRGGRLIVFYQGNRVLEVGARELYDGMTLVQELLAKWSGKDSSGSDSSQNGFKPPSNFIPLDPR